MGKTYFFTIGVRRQISIHFSKDRHWSFVVYQDGMTEQASKRAKFSEILELLRTSKEFEFCSENENELKDQAKQLFGV